MLERVYYQYLMHKIVLAHLRPNTARSACTTFQPKEMKLQAL